MNISNIPFLDLVTPHRELQEELISVFRNALETAGFIGGPAVESFEKEFARFCEVPHCIGVSSGTDAVRFALLAAGIGRGDIVITVPNTFIATTEAITQAGAIPKFVDIDERTYNMDPVKLKEYLESQCRINGTTGALEDRVTMQRIAAVLPVHLYGQMADMDPIMEQAQRYRLHVIEDACQAHGAEYYSERDQRWHKAGSMGIASAFSFYPGKNLGACGEAGAITTADAEIAQKVKMLRDHGQAKKYYHDIEGYNGRLDAIQAGFLAVKLKHLSQWNAKRRDAAACYNELFAGTECIVTPFVPSYSRHIYHLYVIRSTDRAGLQAHLGKEGIGTGIHYPIPLHLQKAYTWLSCRPGDFPICERLANQVLSLPIYPQITEEQQRIVADSVRDFITTTAAPAAEVA